MQIVSCMKKFPSDRKGDYEYLWAVFTVRNFLFQDYQKILINNILRY